MISEKEVGHIAGLARLELSGPEKEKFRKELSLILDYIAQLDKLSVENAEPTTGGSGISNQMREDQPQENDAKRVKKMLEQVPETKAGFVKVGAIIKKE